VKAVVVSQFGGPENLSATTLPDPVPGPGEVLLRVRACALNHLDIFVREGIPAYKIELPHVLGCDVSGEVAALGAGVTAAKVGDRVAVAPGRSCGHCDFCLDGRDHHCARYGIIGAQGGPGGYAQLLAVPQRHLLPLAPAMSFEEGAAFPLTFLTAWHMLMTLGGCGPGQWALVLGAGSGVGVAAIQLAKLAGAKVIAVSTSQEKLEKAKGLGADETILTPAQDIVKQTLKFTGGRMADIAVEHVGPAVFDAALKSLRSGGKLVTCGSTTGPNVTLDMRYVFSRQYQILGSKMGSQGELRKVASLVAEGRLKPIVDKTFDLADARAAHEYLAAKRQFGKVVLSVF
jgi:NADPH:quinone reductase-like Zn-dependent oxidoreductase